MTQDKQVRCTIYFHVLHDYIRFCCIRYTARTNSAYYSILSLSTHINHASDYITPNYTSVTHRDGICQGTVALYRVLTRITFSDITSECISQQVSRNNNRINETRLSGTMNYITTYHAITHGSGAFGTLQGCISRISGY